MIRISKREAEKHGLIPKTKSAPRGMNKTERAYADYLERGRSLCNMDENGQLLKFWLFEAVRLKLARGAWFKPDFMLVYDDRIEFHDVKGFMREAANVRNKVAARFFPMFKFQIVRRLKSGDWSWTPVEV